MSELNIYQRLAKVTEELDVVIKKMTVGIGKAQYKGVGEVDVLNAVKPLESKYGIYSYPMNREVVSAETFVGEKPGYKKDDPPKTTYKFVLRLKTTYRFVNIDNPSEFVDQVMISDGEDPMDKAPGKAATYGDKFSLLKAYKIVTGVDTDNNHSDDTTPTNMKPYKQNKSYKPKQAPQDSGKLYEEVIKLKLSAEDTAKWVKYYKVNSLFDLDNEQLQFIIDRFANRLGK